MIMSLKIPSFLVSVNWLLENLENESLLILDATIPKVGSKTTENLEEKNQIKNAYFFDLNEIFAQVFKSFNKKKFSTPPQQVSKNVFKTVPQQSF